MKEVMLSIHHGTVCVTTSDVTPAKRRYFRPSAGPRDTKARTRPTRRRQSWRPERETPPGTAPCWTTSDGWLAAVAAALDTPEGDAARRATSIKVATVLDIAAADASSADRLTGRNVATAHATVAQLLGCSARTVRRARHLIEKLGLAVTVETGRYLTREERAEARKNHGKKQIRMASRRSLIMPQKTVMRNVPLPRRGQVSINLTKSLLTKKRQKQRGSRKFSLETQRLAGRLATRMPWLAAGHIGTLCRALVILKIDPDVWTAQRIIDALERKNRASGLFSVPRGSIKQPIALFIHECRQAGVCDPAQATPPSGFTPQTPESPTEQAVRRSESREMRRQAAAADREAAAAFKADPAAQQRRAELMAEARRKIRDAARPSLSACQRQAHVLTQHLR